MDSVTIRPSTCALGIVAALLAGCRGSSAPRPEPPAGGHLFKVAKTAIAEQPVEAVITLTGTLTAEVRTDLAANASGRVVRTFVERGQRVDRGAVLAQLDVRSAEAGAAEARALTEGAVTRLEAAEADCARLDTLAADGAASEQQQQKQAAACREQRAALAASRARLDAAALTQKNGTIRAPFAGIVTERFVSAGDYVQASSRIVTLVVGDPLRLRLSVPERRIGEVKQGAVVTFAPSSMPDRTFSGRIRYLSGEVRASTRDMVVEAVLANPDGTLLPGMFGLASIHLGERPMPVVPRSAIVPAGQDAGLFVVKNGELVLRTVLLGARSGKVVAIEEGATPGDVVVTNPTPALFDGARVE